MSVLDNVGKIYMTGIGGAGMCALAQLLTGMGYEVEGSVSYTHLLPCICGNAEIRLYCL